MEGIEVESVEEAVAGTLLSATPWQAAALREEKAAQARALQAELN